MGIKQIVFGHPRRWVQAVCGALAVCLLMSLGGFYGRCQQVQSSVVRLHILANSDSEEDQRLKCQVRDAVVEAAAGWLDGAANAEEALTLARRHLPRLQAVAQQTVTDAGYDYGVEATLCEMYFTTRQYDAVTLPAGVYEAVRFTIGAGEGKNWWCVVFPPMCVGAATDSAALSDVLDPAGEALVTGGQRYILRFKVVEWWESLLQFFRHV